MKTIKKGKSVVKIISFIFIIAVLLISFFISHNIFFGISSKTVYSFFGIKEFSWNGDDYPLSVHFINVGCGDCILIKCDGKTALIDTGSFTFNHKAKYYLEHSGVQNIDLFIATHTDSDHIGDFQSIADNFEIEELWINKIFVTEDGDMTEEEKRFFNKIEEKNIKISFPDINQCYSLGRAKLYVLSPFKDYDNDNDNSFIIRFIYDNVSFLFTGDAGEDTEKDLISSYEDLNSTVLKLSHHGSKTATTQEFLEKVTPEYAVISVGNENKYLPNRDVVERINQFGSEILRTDIDGTIIIATNGKTIEIFKENSE